MPLVNQSVVLGEEAVVECAAKGDNPIIVEWTRSGRQLDHEELNRIIVSWDWAHINS